MKKSLFLSILVLSVCFCLNGYARGGFRSSGHSFRSSRTSSHSFWGGKSTTSKVGKSTHTNSVRSARFTRPVTYYRNNPSYKMMNNRYYPVYHRSPNMMLWYFVILNQRTHRNDTIKAKSRTELDKKVNSTSSAW